MRINLLNKLTKLTNFGALYLFGCLFFSRAVLGEGFVAGTLVATPNSYVAIEQLQKGDYILSYNFESATFIEDQIIEIKKNTTKKIIQITLGDVVLEVDPDHKFYCPLLKNRWVKAKDLQERHFILKNISEVVRIDNIVKIDKETDVYCLSVKNNHNFLVTEQNILVHNLFV